MSAFGVVASSVVAAMPAAAAASTDAMSVDLSQSTGAFRGGANGTLYGLSDAGVPSQPVLNGAHITNTSQRPPDGLQHPNGDALQVESSFFAGAGKDLYVYIQDAYPSWPYNDGQRPGDANHDGVWDYLPIIKAAVEKVATTSTHPQDYVFVPFNEPDGLNWYPDWNSQKDQFLSDWSAAYDTIEGVYAEHHLGHARIGGPGDSTWQPQRTTDIFSYAKARNQLPDIAIWHELDPNDLAYFRGHVTQFRSIEDSLGVSPLPVNITEYGQPHDMGVPGSLVQWLSMFEDEKVDAQTAYWNYAGNLDDNSSRANGGNGGWWLFKWYGDLTGSQTVQVAPPQLNATGTLQGIAAVDRLSKKATVLLGGGSNAINLSVKGIDAATFGSTVNVQVRADRLNGAEGSSQEPPIVQSTAVPVINGQITLPISNADPTTAYQVIVTPMTTAPQPVSTDLVNSTEAEAATLSSCTIYNQDPSNTGIFLASGNHDVGSFNQPSSSATWSVTAPESGSYRLDVLAGANQNPGEHALFIDGTFSQLVHYSADLGWQYRGTSSVTFPLSAGAHTLSLRASKDGTTTLPGADITLDRFDLYKADVESQVYPASDARLTGGSHLDYSNSSAAGYATLAPGSSATFFASTVDTGYYDVTAHYATFGAATVSLMVDGQRVDLAAARGAGSWASTARIYLSQGINQIDVSTTGSVLLGDISTSRGQDQRATDSDPSAVEHIPAASLRLSGSATTAVMPASAGSNGPADASGNVTKVTGLGTIVANTAAFSRPAGFGVGEYVMTVGYANADRNTGINYNPQVVTRFLDVTETGGASLRAPFRHNYSWNSFWDKSFPLNLTTPNGDITLGNATGPGPDVDGVTLAKLVDGTPTTNAYSIASTVQHLVTAAIAPVNGWYTTAATVSLLAITPGARIQYSVDSGPWKQYRAPISVSSDGRHVISTRMLTDGSVAADSTSQFELDKDGSSPAISATRTAAKGTPLNPVTIMVSATDPTSGVASLQYAVNSGGWQDMDPGTPLTLSTPGTYSVAYRATNGAGLTSQVKSTTVTITPNTPTTLRPSVRTASAGDYLSWTFTGFHRFTPVTLSMGSTTLGEVTTDVNGAAQLTVQIPLTADVGNVTVTAAESGTDALSTSVTLKLTAAR